MTKGQSSALFEITAIFVKICIFSFWGLLFENVIAFASSPLSCIWYYFIYGVSVFQCVNDSAINNFSPELLDYALENKLTVLAVWNAIDCKKCAHDMWDIYQLFHAYGGEEVVAFVLNHL